MRYTKLLTISLFAMLCCASFVGAVELDSEYQKSLAKYYSVSEGVVAEIAATGLPVEELPVVLRVAKRTKMAPAKVAKIRSEGHSWLTIANVRGMKPGDFYVIVTGEIGSETFAPIFHKFKSTPKREWKDLQLSDSEIINLVNLKFIASNNDYSIYEAMALCDDGKSFVEINHEIKERKAEYVAVQEKRPRVLQAGMGSH